jgi:hypothetical protein
MDVKKELHEQIGTMGLRVKFEMLHDEVPQVSWYCIGWWGG